MSQSVSGALLSKATSAVVVTPRFLCGVPAMLSVECVPCPTSPPPAYETLSAYSRAHVPAVRPPWAPAVAASPATLPAVVLPMGRSLLPPAPAPTPDQALLAQLAPLASQHHLSAYNRSKALPQHIRYVPFSIHSPDVASTLHTRQQAQWSPASGPRFFPARAAPPFFLDSAGSSSHSNTNPISDSTTESSTETDISLPPKTLEHALKVAIAQPLDLHPRPEDRKTLPAPTTPYKTSESHPLHISTLIPPELLILVAQSAHTATCGIPNHLVTALLASTTPSSSGSHRVIQVPPFNNHATPPSHPAPQSRGLQRQAAPGHIPLPLPPRLSAIDTRDDLNTPGPAIPSRPHSWSGREVTDPFDPAQMPLPPSPVDGPSISTSTPSISSPLLDLPPPPPPKPARLGNLHMSSCPGKKVRLAGGIPTPVIPGAPIRPGVLRSLRSDLSRIASLGIRLIILCLDDTELSLLGAPWNEYEVEASQIGLDVLRLPMPEGFAGPDVEGLRGEMRRVVGEYTRQGKDVLVHCRGGLGRAGVVAACWAMEVGWLGVVPPMGSEGVQARGVDRASLVLVERAVGLLRRRRSTKAIETAEQVLFLVRYVEAMRRDVGGSGM